MNLRVPNYLDIPFLVECYKSWPVTADNPPIYEADIRNWVTRWNNRTHDNGQRVHAYIIEDPEAIGYIQYREVYGIGIYVDNLIIHPDHQGQGKGSQFIKDFKDYVVSQGALVGEFEAFGKMAEWVESRFEKIGEAEGKTGPLVVGRITVDMEV